MADDLLLRAGEEWLEIVNWLDDPVRPTAPEIVTETVTDRLYEVEALIARDPAVTLAGLLAQARVAEYQSRGSSEGDDIHPSHQAALQMVKALEAMTAEAKVHTIARAA